MGCLFPIKAKGPDPETLTHMSSPPQSSPIVFSRITHMGKPDFWPSFLSVTLETCMSVLRILATDFYITSTDEGFFYMHIIDPGIL